MTAVLDQTAEQPARAPGRSRLAVGYVMHSMQVAGAEVLVAEMARRLSASIAPTIICLDEVGALGEQLRREGVDVVALGRRPGIDLRLPHRIAGLVRDRGIDLLHAHQYTPYFYSALARVRGARTRILFTEHGRHYPDVVGWKRRWGNRLFISRFSDHTTACCRFAADALEQKDGFRRGSVQVLPNGIDLEKFSASTTPRGLARERLGLDPALQYVCTVARFHPVKNHALLVRAFATVSQASPAARLLLVGDGPERASIESLARELGLADRVTFTGVRHDVADFLSASDVFVLPSLSEAASLTLLEAMACGAAVVVTDVGGNPEIVRHGVDGLLTPSDDPAAMAEAILTLLADPERRRALGEYARRRVAAEYDLSRILQRYLRLYQQLAGGTS